MADRLTKEQRHKNMANIKSKNTSIELAMRKVLRNNGFGYRLHYKLLPGKPDIVLTKYKIAIFCDSEFFHGKDFDNLKIQLQKGNNADFWIEKISKNVERDRKIDIEIKNLGWNVLRFWGKDIIKNPDECLRVIRETIMDSIIEDSYPLIEENTKF